MLRKLQRYSQSAILQLNSVKNCVQTQQSGCRRRRTNLTPVAAAIEQLENRVLLSGVTDSPSETAAQVGNVSQSIWSDADAPLTDDNGDSSAVEVGMKFRSDVEGYVAGVRIYKSVANTGLHTGRIAPHSSQISYVPYSKGSLIALAWKC